MAKLRMAMDASFWDLNISSPQALDGVARAVPGNPVPLDGARASKALRIQQISLLQNGFPWGIIPSFSPSPNHKELGSLALQSLLGRVARENWWVGLVGQLRPKKLISSIKADVSAPQGRKKIRVIKDAAKHFMDKSLYAIALCSQIALTSSTSLLLSTEKHGEKKRRRTKAMVFHELPEHDVTLEAAWPELFIDHNGKYFEVPESISLDCSSLVSRTGFRYRFGLHKTSGHPQAVGSINAQTPLALLPGLCAKAAFSFEKSKDLWREKEAAEDVIEDLELVEEGEVWSRSYDVRLKEPHAAISGLIGGTCETWLDGRKEGRGRFGADLFGSLCYTYQHGKFSNKYGDLTRIDARLDIASASALAKSVFRSARPSNELASPSPRLNLIFQQQIAGPIVFRVDTKFLPSLSPLEDVICSLNYSLRTLQSGKVVAWYSPKRNEGMIELRLFDF